MNHSTRRDFLQTSVVLAAAAVAGSSFEINKQRAHLSFSTLGCPDWSFDQIIQFAAQHKYDGLEIRGLQRQMDLPKCPEFSNAENRASTMKKMEAKGLRFVNLGSSSTLHFAEGPERHKNLDEGRRYIDLAQQLSCPHVRVFPNNFPKGQEKNLTIDLIAKGMIILADHAKGSGVKVLMETHGDLVKTEDIELIMSAAAHTNAGLVWDVTNMYIVTKEAPLVAYNKLKQYIHHTHIKDAKMVDGKIQYTFLGKGEVPVLEAIKVLETGAYKGFYSFEWEKLWHPELAEPELAFADYVTVMKRYLSGQRSA